MAVSTGLIHDTRTCPPSRVCTKCLCGRAFLSRFAGLLGTQLGIPALRILFIVDNRDTVNLDFNYFFANILKPLLKNVIRNFVFNTKRLERFAMRQSPCLVLKAKPFKIFTAIHDSKIFVCNEDKTFNQ